MVEQQGAAGTVPQTGSGQISVAAPSSLASSMPAYQASKTKRKALETLFAEPSVASKTVANSKKN